MPRIFTILNFRVPIDSSSRKNDTKTTTKFCLHLGWKKAMSSPSESRNDQCIGNLCVDKIQSPRIRDLCVAKTRAGSRPPKFLPRKFLPRKFLPRKFSGRDHPPNAQTAGELCVDKTQSSQICNLCVEKNPRPRRARTNSRAHFPYWKIDQWSFCQ